MFQLSLLICVIVTLLTHVGLILSSKITLQCKLNVFKGISGLSFVHFQPLHGLYAESVICGYHANQFHGKSGVNWFVGYVGLELSNKLLTLLWQ